MPDELRTTRLILRRWQPNDESFMQAVNSDTEVTRLLNRPVDETGIRAFHGLMLDHWERYGYGPWAIESQEAAHVGEFLGFAGLAQLPPFLSDAGSGPELGWRLARNAWGRGLATEAAIAARDHAVETLRFTELVSVIHPENSRSQSVARKLGMKLEREVQNPAIDRAVQVWVFRADQVRAERPTASLTSSTTSEL